MKSRIEPEIGEELRIAGVVQLRDKVKNDPKYLDYDILSFSERDYIEIIKKEDVPYLSGMMISTADPKLDTIGEDHFDKIWGYMVRIENKDEILFLFKKYTPKKLLEKGKIPMVCRQGHFEKLESQIVAIEDNYDAALLIKENRKDRIAAEPFMLLIFNKSQFESLFSFMEFYKKVVEDKFNYIKDKALFDDTGKLIKCCQNDARKIRKLARIINNGLFESMNLDKIKANAEAFNLKIEFDGDWKIKINELQIWEILKILDDDYVKSEITDHRYEAHAKMKV